MCPRPKGRKILAGILCATTAFASFSCADMGVGEHETSFYDYFSRVYLFSTTDFHREKISTFNAEINDADELMKVVVPFQKYSYIAFHVAKGYTLEVEEFACHAKTNGAEAQLQMDFYITTVLPTKVNVGGENKDYPSIDDEEDSSFGSSDSSNSSDSSEEAIEEKNVFLESAKFSSTTMRITQEWDSMLLSFDTPQTVYARQFIVIRARNNCSLDWDSLGQEPPDPVDFTMNYLMFRFTKVEKK